MSETTPAPEDLDPELLVPTEFPEDEFPDPAQDAEDLGKEES